MQQTTPWKSVLTSPARQKLASTSHLQSHRRKFLAIVASLSFCVPAFCMPAELRAANPVAAEQKPVATPQAKQADIVIYGASSGGIAAAIQATRMGKSVILIEPSSHLGGLTTGGLGATDIGNKAAIGGVSREFYQRVGKWYANPENWVQEPASKYNERRKSSGENEMWTFEPHVAMRVYQDWLKEYPQITLIMNERLDLKTGVRKQPGSAAIHALVMESGNTYQGKVFIDATYEGDLMAKAGVPYHVGREAASVYNEDLNGIRVAKATHHQFTNDVDPYVIPGKPESGLIPLIQAGGPGEDGAGDHRVQAYNFRMCTTDVPENRVAWPKPEGYNEKTYELVLRNFEAGYHRRPWNPVWMPNRKTDTNNNFAVSTDYIGANYEYPDANYAKRKEIFEDHKRYQQGLMWTLANHPRVPESVREHFQKLGLAKDEFVDSGNWPPQLYVREARRMISDYVMTQSNCQRKAVAEDSVGMGAYNMDSHNCQRYVTKEGFVRNEGDIQVGVPPYPISYRSIRPAREHATNLLVPVCLAASHISYGSIRMEPVFMVLGQSAATAASMAIDGKSAVQDVDYSKLREKLLADHQVLEWQGPRNQPGGTSISSLGGVVADDTAAVLKGEWLPSSSIGGFVAAGYVTDGNEGKGQKLAVFEVKVPTAGSYDIRMAWTANANRATNVPVIIESGTQKLETQVNQRNAPGKDGFQTLGRMTLNAGDVVKITVSNEKTNGYVVVDAVQALPVQMP